MGKLTAPHPFCIYVLAISFSRSENLPSRELAARALTPSTCHWYQTGILEKEKLNLRLLPHASVCYYLCYGKIFLVQVPGQWFQTPLTAQKLEGDVSVNLINQTRKSGPVVVIREGQAAAITEVLGPPVY